MTAIPEVVVTSDASGNWGCSAWSGTSWFQYQWPCVCEHHISFKELFALLLAAAAWGAKWSGKWSGKTIRWRCDNQAAVRVILTRLCRDNAMMHLLRCLFFFEAHYQFQVVAVHVPGKENVLADDLSRDHLSSFLSKAPQMAQVASTFPQQLPAVLLTPGNWMCPRWTKTFASFFNEVSPAPLKGRIEPE